MGWPSSTGDAYPEPPRALRIGKIHGNAINADLLRRDGSTYVSSAEPDFSPRTMHGSCPCQRRSGPTAVSHPRLVRPLPLPPGREPRSCRHRPGEGAALPRPPRSLSAAVPLRPHRRVADERLIDRLGSPNIFFRESAQLVLAERAARRARAARGARSGRIHPEEAAPPRALGAHRHGASPARDAPRSPRAPRPGGSCVGRPRSRRHAKRGARGPSGHRGGYPGRRARGASPDGDRRAEGRRRGPPPGPLPDPRGLSR